MPSFKDGPKGMVVVDDRYAPLLVSSFIGEINLEQGQWFEQTVTQLLRREGARGRRVVNIHDTTRSTRTSPEMRKFWAEMSSRNTEEMERLTLANLIVITNPLIRGVLTAVGWMNPKVAELEILPSLDAALGAGAKLLAGDGNEVRLPTGGYRLPEDVVAAVG